MLHVDMIYDILLNRTVRCGLGNLTLQIYRNNIMISLTKKLLLITLSCTLLTASSQERCITEHFLENVNSVFTCDFQRMNKVFNRVDDESKCVHFLGLPDIQVCGEMGLRFKTYSDDVNFTISLSYYPDKYSEINYVTIENGKNGWNHWSKTICADFKYGVSMFEQNILCAVTFSRKLNLFIMKIGK